MTKDEYRNFLSKVRWMQRNFEAEVRRKVTRRGTQAFTSKYGVYVYLDWSEKYGPLLRLGLDGTQVATGLEAVVEFDRRTTGGAHSWKNDRVLPF